MFVSSTNIWHLSLYPPAFVSNKISKSRQEELLGEGEAARLSDPELSA